MLGFYIVIEGPQGVGKSTQVKLLENALSLIGVPVKTFKEPDSSVNLTTQAISNITQDPKYPLNPKAEVLLYNASRAISLETITKYKNNGYVCIVDRSYLSTLAVQYYSNNNNLDYNSIINILNFSIGNNWPDYMLILDAPAQYLHQRQQKRNEHERFDALGLAKLDKIRAGYLIEAKKRNIPVITATESPIMVHGKIWQHIQKVLSNNYTKQQLLLTQDVKKHTDSSIGKHSLLNNITVNNVLVSELLLPKLSSIIKFTTSNNKNESDFIVPNGLPRELRSKYIQSIKKIAGYNLQINNKLKDIDVNDARSLATVNNISFIGTSKEYASLLKHLLLENSQESLKIYKILKLKLKDIDSRYFNTKFFAKLDTDIYQISKSTKHINAQINKIMADLYSNNLELLQLTNFSPKNELTLLNNIIYNKTELSGQEINSQLLKANYINKANLLAKHINGNNLANLPAYYTWELITSYSNYLEFTKIENIKIYNQVITPRYGYNIPSEIEKSGALDEYLECFDASLELHSMLITNNISEEITQYACLKGHKIRFSVQTNIDQSLNIIKMFNKSNNTDLANIAKQMIIKISETHPIISESITLD